MPHFTAAQRRRIRRATRHEEPEPGDDELNIIPFLDVVVNLIMFLLLLPGLGLLVAQLLTGNALFGWLALLVGVAEGAVLLVLGIRIGGRWLEARMPELMQAVMVNR